MKFAVACLCSAIIGGLVAVWLVESRITSSNSAIAQERFREGPALPSDDAPPAMGNLRPNAGWVGPATPAPLPAFAADGLTPEERINVAVYERVNKSVAHITLKGARSDSFWATEVPAEGTGSGSVIDRQGHILTNYHVLGDPAEAIECRRCRTTFPVRDGIPVMLLDDATPGPQGIGAPLGE